MVQFTVKRKCWCWYCYIGSSDSRFWTICCRNVVFCSALDPFLNNLVVICHNYCSAVAHIIVHCMIYHSRMWYVVSSGMWCQDLNCMQLSFCGSGGMHANV